MEIPSKLLQRLSSILGYCPCFFIVTQFVMTRVFF